MCERASQPRGRLSGRAVVLGGIYLEGHLCGGDLSRGRGVCPDTVWCACATVPCSEWYAFTDRIKPYSICERHLFISCTHSIATMELTDARLSAIFAGSFLVAYVIWKFVREARTPETRRRPPSIWSLPFVGSVLFLPNYRSWHREFLAMSAKIGNVFAFYMGSQ